MAQGCDNEASLAGGPQPPSSTDHRQPDDDAALQGTAAALGPASSNGGSGNKRDAVLAGCIEPCLLIAADAAAAAGAGDYADFVGAQCLAAEAISTLSSCVRVGWAGGWGPCSGCSGEVEQPTVSVANVVSVPGLLPPSSPFAGRGRSDIGPSQAGRRSEGPCI